MHPHRRLPHIRGVVAFSIFVAVCASAPASSQDSTTPPPDHLAALRSCQQITDSAERLACFDKAAGAMIAANQKGDLKVINQEDIKKTRRSLFGFALPDIDLFGGDGKDEQIDLMESRITRVRYLQSDSFTFQIEDGNAIWQVNNAPSRLRQVAPGDTVVFKKASLGSYFVRINGQMGVKGRRIQ